MTLNDSSLSNLSGFLFAPEGWGGKPSSAPVSGESQWSPAHRGDEET